MNEFVYKLTLDLNCAKTPPVICSGQFDKGRKFEFTITANGEPYDVTGCSAVLKGVRTDGSHFAVECTVSDGKIIKTLDDTTLSIRGKTVAKLVISDSTKSYSTQMFIIDVDSALDGDITVADDYSILNRLIEQIHALNESGAILIDDSIDKNSNNAVANKAVAIALAQKSDKSATYTKTEVDTALNKKPDKATTLADYGITDGENIGNKVTDKRKITDENANYPSIGYLNGYYYDYSEVDDALSGKLDNTAGSVKTDNIASKAVTTDKLTETVKNDISSKASSMALIETGYLQLKDINNNVLSSVKLPTSAPADIRAELENLISEGAISGIATGVYNVVDFGAVGDGVTDDTAAFKKCIKTANGNPILIPSGTYVVNHCSFTEEETGYPINLLGIGNPVIKRTALSDATPSESKARSMFLFRNVPSAEITGITFDSCRDDFIYDSTGEWLGTAILYFYGDTSNINIHSCTFKNCSREAVYIKGSFNNVTMRENVLKNISAHFWNKGGNGENFIYENNISENGRTKGIEFDTEDGYKVSNIQIRKNKFINMCSYGVLLQNCESVVIDNNYYIMATELNEHAVGTQDNLSQFFVYMGCASTNNSCKDINIINNYGNAHRVVSIQKPSAVEATETDRMFEDISLKNNNFSVANIYVSAGYTSNLVVNNCSGKSDGDFIFLTNSDNVSISNNSISAVNFIRGKGNDIKIISNIMDVEYPLNFDSTSYKATLKLSLINNEAATWSKIGLTNLCKTTPWTDCYGNTGAESAIMVAALGAKTNEKYNVNVSSIHDINALPLTENVVIRTITSYARIGRVVKVLICGGSVTTDTSATTVSMKINNEITVPDGGILTLTYTGSGWYAS